VVLMVQLSSKMTFGEWVGEAARILEELLSFFSKFVGP
jgi:hypothetical protein